MQVPPRRLKISTRKCLVPDDAAKKVLKLLQRRSLPRPTTWANGTPVGFEQTNIIHPLLQAQVVVVNPGRTPSQRKIKQAHSSPRTPAKKRPTLSSDTGGGRRSSNVTYDYSALDEARDKYAKRKLPKVLLLKLHLRETLARQWQPVMQLSLQQQARAAEMQGPRIRQKQSSFTAQTENFNRLESMYTYAINKAERISQETKDKKEVADGKLGVLKGLAGVGNRRTIGGKK